MAKGTNKKKIPMNKVKMLLVLVPSTLVVVLTGVIVVLLKRPPAVQEEKEPEKRNVVVTPDNIDEVIGDMSQWMYTEPGYYTVSMDTDWHFATGDAVSDDARVDNVVGNTNPVYFDVFLTSDESEPIYESPVIPVGSYLNQIQLKKPLEAGTHDCVIVYHLVNDNQDTISTLRVAFQIIVDA